MVMYLGMSTQIRTHRNFLGARCYGAMDMVDHGRHGGIETGIRRFQRLLRFLHEVILHDSMFFGASTAKALSPPCAVLYQERERSRPASLSTAGRPGAREPVSMPEPNVLVEAVVVLAAAVVGVLLAERLRLGAILGYLAAGLVIGPAGLRLVHDSG